MVAATVIDGKVYVGNDYGAVYCISDVAGPQVGDSGEIVLENGDSPNIAFGNIESITNIPTTIINIPIRILSLVLI